MKGICMDERTDIGYFDKILDMFDEQFSVASFVEKIEADNSDSKETISSAKEIVRKNMSKTDEKKLYVDLPDELKQSLENGEAEFIKGKNNKSKEQAKNILESGIAEKGFGIILGYLGKL